MPVSAKPSDAEENARLIVNYDELFKHPLLPPDPPPSHLRHEPDFFSRHRNAVWWVILFLLLGVSTVALVISDSAVFADSGCSDW